MFRGMDLKRWYRIQHFNANGGNSRNPNSGISNSFRCPKNGTVHVQRDPAQKFQNSHRTPQNNPPDNRLYTRVLFPCLMPKVVGKQNVRPPGKTIEPGYKRLDMTEKAIFRNDEEE
jgi:hypothetical protein